MTKREKRAAKVANARRGRGTAGVRAPHQNKPVRKVILIATEGEKTEPGYLTWLKGRIRNVHLEIRFRDSNSQSVIDAALDGRRESGSSTRRGGRTDEAYDDVWAFIDVDDHADLDAALIRADKEGVKVALSGPCFESWLLMHFAPQGRAFEKAQHAKRAWATKSSGKDDYNSLLLEHLPDALKNAAAKRRQDEQNGIERTKRDPSAEVDLFIRALAGLEGVDPEHVYTGG